MYRFMITAAVVVGSVLLGLNPAQARGPNLRFGSPAVEPGPDNHHSSTLAEGVLTGQARKIGAIGQAVHNLAVAARHVEEARNRVLENAVLETQVYYRRKTAHADYVSDLRQRRPVRPAPEQISRINERNQPQRLRTYQLHGPTGAIYWPEALRDARFEGQRYQLDKLFAERTPANSGLGTQNQIDIKREVGEMRELVRQTVRAGEMGPDAFSVAVTFLKSLGYEAHFPMELEYERLAQYAEK